MSLNQQTRGVLLSYGQQLTMKKKHSLKLMTTNTMNMYQQTPQQSLQHKNHYVKNLFKFGDTDYKTLQYLLPPTQPCTPIFYLLPKIHKPGTPGRPIISGCVSSIIDSHIKPLWSSLPSYIKDTNNFTIYKIFSPSTNHYHPTPS